MTIESRELESAREFLKLEGISARFARFHQKREQALIDGAKPKFYISRHERFGQRREGAESANITPWLRTARVDQIQRLIDIDSEKLANEDEDDTADDHFLDEIWAHQPDKDFDNLDEGDDDWSRCYAYQFKLDLDKLKAVIKESNPVVYRHLFISPEELGQTSLAL